MNFFPTNGSLVNHFPGFLSPPPLTDEEIFTRHVLGVAQARRECEKLNSSHRAAASKFPVVPSWMTGKKPKTKTKNKNP